MELSSAPFEISSSDHVTFDPTSYEDNKSDSSQPASQNYESSEVYMRGDLQSLPDSGQDGEVRMRGDLQSLPDSAHMRDDLQSLPDLGQGGEVRIHEEPRDEPQDGADDVITRNDGQQMNFQTECENFNGIDDMINLCKIIDSTLHSISVTSIEFVIFRLNFHKININDFMTDFLNSSIFHNSLSSLQHLLRNYCTQNLNEYNVYKRLNRSAMLCIEYKKPECLRQLLLYGTLVDNRQVQARFPEWSTSSHSLIHKFITCISPHADIEEKIINTLYQFGINLYEKNDSGQTALQVLQTSPQSAVLYNEALEETRQNISEKLQDMMSEPLTLLSLSRLAILRSMGRNYIRKLEELSPLPRTIVKYLKFEELQSDNDIESGFDSESSNFDNSAIENEYIWNQIDNSIEDNDSNYTDFNEENNSVYESDNTEDLINEIFQEYDFNFNEDSNSINLSINETESNLSSDYEVLTVSIQRESHISYPHQLNESSNDDE